MTPVRVSGEITDETAARFLADLGEASDPVTMVVDTIGGRVAAALTMAAAIERRPVHAVVQRADSAGLALVAAAGSREYAANASAIVHPVTVTVTRPVTATVGELREVTEDAETNERAYRTLLARFSGKPVEWWQDTQAREVTLDAAQLSALFPPGDRRVPVPTALATATAVAEALARVDWSTALSDALRERGWHPGWGRYDQTATYIEGGWSNT